MSLRTHTNRAYATRNGQVGEYALREGRAIPTLLAYQLERGGYGEWFQWRRKKRERALTASEFKFESAVRQRLRVEARQVPCPRPVAAENNTVFVR